MNEQEMKAFLIDAGICIGRIDAIVCTNRPKIHRDIANDILATLDNLKEHLREHFKCPYEREYEVNHEKENP